MNAKITARWWNEDFKTRFGEQGSIHEFPNDTETFLKEMIPFGRFEIQMYNGLLELEFQNDYD